MRLKLLFLIPIVFAFKMSFALNCDGDGLVVLDKDLSRFSKSEKEGLLKNNNFLLSKVASNEMQKIRLEFNTISGPGVSRELLLGFSDYTSDAYDYGYEAKNSDLTIDDLHLDLDGVDYNIQAYGPLTNDKVVSLNFKSSGTNTFEIRITELENIEEGQEIYLRDNLTGTYFDLTEYIGYSFSSEQGVFKDRFEIVFQSEQSLSTVKSAVTEKDMYYQNATSSLFVKKLTSSINNLSIVSMLGHTVIEMANVSNTRLENGLQINDVSTGAYVVRLITDTNEVLTKKIIVK